MKYSMEEEIALELTIAMRKQPNMQVIDLIYAAADVAFPTRVSKSGGWGKNTVKFKLSNADILNSLRKYNRLRSMDAARYVKSGK